MQSEEYVYSHFPLLGSDDLLFSVPRLCFNLSHSLFSWSFTRNLEDDVTSVFAVKECPLQWELQREPWCCFRLTSTPSREAGTPLRSTGSTGATATWTCLLCTWLSSWKTMTGSSSWSRWGTKLQTELFLPCSQDKAGPLPSTELQLSPPVSLPQEGNSGVILMLSIPCKFQY